MSRSGRRSCAGGGRPRRCGGERYWRRPGTAAVTVQGMLILEGDDILLNIGFTYKILTFNVPLESGSSGSVHR